MKPYSDQQSRRQSSRTAAAAAAAAAGLYYEYITRDVLATTKITLFAVNMNSCISRGAGEWAQSFAVDGFASRTYYLL